MVGLVVVVVELHMGHNLPVLDMVMEVMEIMEEVETVL